MRRITQIIVTAFVFAFLGASTFFVSGIRDAHKVLQQQKARLKERQWIPVETRPFTLSPNSDFRFLTGPPEIRSAVVFQEKIYAASSQGLLVFTPDGKPIEHHTTIEGLPSLDLTTLVVHQKNLWIGTSDTGLFRLENKAGIHFLPGETARRHITVLHSTPQGTLLIGTAKGLLLLQDDHFQPISYQELANSRITAIHGDAYRFFVGTFDSGLYLMENGTFRKLQTADPLITDILEVAGTIFVATANGVEKLDLQGFSTPILQKMFVTSIVSDGSGLYAAIRGSGILKLDLSKFRTPADHFRTPTPDAIVTRLLDRIFVFSSGKGWYRDETGWKIWTETKGTLRDSNISALWKSRNGKIWIGYFDQGLEILSEQLQPSGYLKDETLFCINHISEDEQGRVYVSTANGLVIVHPDGSRKIYRTADGLLSDRVMQALPLDPSGNRVAIATAQGYSLKEGEQIKSIYGFHGLVNNRVYTLAGAGKQVYAGTLGGISRIEDLKVVQSWTKMNSGLSGNWINALLFFHNQLLIGTYGNGILARGPSGEWITYEELPPDLEVNPNAFFYDGTLVFCGTLDRGFFIYNPENSTWKHFYSSLPSSSVTAFARNGDRLLVATNRGLLQVSYEKINTIPVL